MIGKVIKFEYHNNQIQEGTIIEKFRGSVDLFGNIDFYIIHLSKDGTYYKFPIQHIKIIKIIN